MKLGELAEQAAKLLRDGVSPDAEVYADGCDCVELAESLREYRTWDGKAGVILARAGRSYLSIQEDPSEGIP